MDKYLSFPDEATAKAVLYGAEAAPNYANIDTIGVIYKPVGEPNAEGVQDMQAIPGWHVNVRVVAGEDDQPLQAYEVSPATPVRMWA